MHSYSHIFEGGNLSEGEKILRLNQLARDIIQVERPDMLIVEAPDPVMKYSNNIPNGFGIRTYMASLALMPDQFICCVPYGLAVEKFITSVSRGIMDKYGFPISAVHASNIIVDHLVSLQEQEMSYAYSELQAVSESLKDGVKDCPIPVYNLFEEGPEGLYRHTLNFLEHGGA